uniref:hypothetical protein n=1 Tax=Geobacillus sp. (strain Y412MC10) TaxID=481743 RepID=UPI0011A494A1
MRVVKAGRERNGGEGMAGDRGYEKVKGNLWMSVELGRIDKIWDKLEDLIEGGGGSMRNEEREGVLAAGF